MFREWETSNSRLWVADIINIGGSILNIHGSDDSFFIGSGKEFIVLLNPR